jgi:hypothetical protein
VHEHAQGPRRCLDAIDDPWYEIATKAGACEMYAIPVIGIRVWRRARTMGEGHITASGA